MFTGKFECRRQCPVLGCPQRYGPDAPLSYFFLCMETLLSLTLILSGSRRFHRARR
jgi:hypothetical protein